MKIIIKMRSETYQLHSNYIHLLGGAVYIQIYRFFCFYKFQLVSISAYSLFGLCFFQNCAILLSSLQHLQAKMIKNTAKISMTAHTTIITIPPACINFKIVPYIILYEFTRFGLLKKMISHYIILRIYIYKLILLANSSMIIDFIPLSQRKTTSLFQKLYSNILKKQKQRNRTPQKKSYYTSKKLPDQNVYRMTAHNILVNFQFDKNKKQDKAIQKSQQKREANLNRFKTTFIRKSSAIGQSFNNKKKIGKYSIVRQIGKGGFAKVYQVTDDLGKTFALKEYILADSLQCYHNQFLVGGLFFQNGNIKSEYANQKGINGVIKYIQKWKNGKKGYIVQEIGGTNLSKLLSEIQGTFYNNQRVYQVKFNPFYIKLTQKQAFKNILLQICHSVKCLNSAGLVHCDLKLENIMIQIDQDSNPIVKIIDFGSTFQIKNGLPKITITPEYMPPQLLSMFQNGKNQQERLQKVDVWSIGCVMLQILTGVPLWFRYKCKLQIKGKTVLQMGVFAMANRDYSKIIKKQKQLCQKIDNLPFIFKQFQVFRSTLKKILKFNHLNRVTLQQLINQIDKVK